MHFVIIGGGGWGTIIGGYIPPIPPRFGTTAYKEDMNVPASIL